MIDLKSQLDDTAIRELLSYAIGFPSEAELDRVCARYRADQAMKCLGRELCRRVVGLIGLRIDSLGQAVIKHISVSVDIRRHGIGRYMLNYVIEKYSLTKLAAETDNEAVGFYQKCGFTVMSLGEKYPGVERFQCELNLRILS